MGLDTADHQALIALFGEDAVTKGLSDATLKPEEQEQLTMDLSAYNGQFCYIAEKCAGSDKDTVAKGTCKAGYSVIETAHAPEHLQIANWLEKCDKGKFHRICCPTKAMPKNCEWIGATGSASSCNGKCGASQFELAIDTYRDPGGDKACLLGARSVSP